MTIAFCRINHKIVKTLESCNDESYIADMSEAELKDPVEFVKAVNKLLSK